jgi:hypothetical protein
MEFEMSTLQEVISHLQNQMAQLQAQNETLIQTFQSQQAALNQAQAENAFLRSQTPQLQPPAFPTLAQTPVLVADPIIRQNTLKTKPFDVPLYEGTRGLKWRTFRTQFENEFARAEMSPTPYSDEFKYRFIFSRAREDFLKYLQGNNDRFLEQCLREGFSSVVAILEREFMGENYQAVSRRELEALVDTGCLLKDVHDYTTTFQTLAYSSRFTTDQLLVMYMQGIIKRNLDFYKMNLSSPVFQYNKKAMCMGPENYPELRNHQQAVLEYIDDYLTATSSIRKRAGDIARVPLGNYSTGNPGAVAVPMDISLIDVSDQEQVRNRLTYLLKSVDGKFPPVSGRSAQNKQEQAILAAHHFYHPCRHSYEGQFSKDAFDKHKETCPRLARPKIAVVDVQFTFESY